MVETLSYNVDNVSVSLVCSNQSKSRITRLNYLDGLRNGEQIINEDLAKRPAGSTLGHEK